VAERRLISRKACYHSDQNLVFRLLCRNVNIKVNISVILHVVSYGYEIWCLTLMDDQKLRVFQNRLLMGISGYEKVEVEGDSRRLHNEELHNLYASTNIIRVIK
jgi:hypothetical protein